MARWPAAVTPALMAEPALLPKQCRMSVMGLPAFAALAEKADPGSGPG